MDDLSTDTGKDEVLRVLTSASGVKADVNVNPFPNRNNVLATLNFMVPYC